MAPAGQHGQQSEYIDDGKAATKESPPTLLKIYTQIVEVVS